MKTKKRLLFAVLILLLLSNSFSGCASKSSKQDNTLTLTMWTSAIPQIMDVLRKKFPDINFVVNEYSGGNSSLYLKELLQRDQVGDIFFYTTFYDTSDAPSYLVDLSGYPFLTNYDKAILSTLDVDGAIYQIPGPITIRYVVVNKTLFEERGWKIPNNFDECVEVCRQIREEAPEIAPLGIGSLGMGFVWSLVTSYAQMGFLDTAEGQAAEREYREGTASFGTAFSEGLDMVARLVDAGAFMPERFQNTWDITAKQISNREVAMSFIMNPNRFHTQLFSEPEKGNPEDGTYSTDEFLVLPMYGKNPKNKGLILGTTNTWGLCKHLEEKGNEKKLQNALRVLEYISTEECQLATRSNPAAIPAIKNLHSEDIPEFMRTLWNDSTNSIKSFFLYTGYEHMITETAHILLDAMQKCSSEGMKEEFIRLADRLNEEHLENRQLSGAYGYAEEDFTVAQTRKMSCDAICAAAGTELSMVSESGRVGDISNTLGLAGQLFQGNLTGETLTLITSARKAAVVTLTLSGKEIKTLLETGRTVPNDNGEVSFPYWTNATELNEEQNYLVAMLSGDYPEEFAKEHEFTDTGITISTALEEYFRSKKTIRAD